MIFFFFVQDHHFRRHSNESCSTSAKLVALTSNLEEIIHVFFNVTALELRILCFIDSVSRFVSFQRRLFLDTRLLLLEVGANMAEEEKQSEPVTDKHELQKLKVQNSLLVCSCFYLQPPRMHLFICCIFIKSASCFDLYTGFYNNAFLRFHLSSSRCLHF